MGGALREGLAPEPSTALNDESPPSTPEKRKSFGFRFLGGGEKGGGGGKKKKSSTHDLSEAAAAESKTSLNEVVEAEPDAAEDPIFKLLNEGAAKRNYDRKLSKQKTLTSECEDD